MKVKVADISGIYLSLIAGTLGAAATSGLALRPPAASQAMTDLESRVLAHSSAGSSALRRGKPATRSLGGQ